MDIAVFLLAAASALTVIAKTHSCSTSELESCLAVLQSVAKSEDLALATTKQELHLVCGKLQRGVRCVDDHSSRCFNAAQQRIFDSVVSESRQVIEDLCVDGELQNDYLRYAPCFKNISTDYNKCAAKYKKIAVFSQELKEEDKEVGLKTVCCALKDFTDCKHDHVIRDCAPGASQFLQKHMDRMSGSLINEHCVLYTYGPNSCSSGSLDTRFPERSSLHFSLIFLFAVFFTSLQWNTYHCT